MPDYKKLAKGLNAALRAADAEASALQKMKGAQDVLPAAQRESNKAKFLAKTKDPRRFYHGTGEDISQFTPSHKGAFVSPEAEFAGQFAKSYDEVIILDDDKLEFGKLFDLPAPKMRGPNVMPVRVMVENPFDYDNPAHMKALREAASKRFPGRLRYEIDGIAGVDDSGGMYNNWASVEHPDIQKLIRQLGHDSYYTSERGVKNLGIYDPRRIKSDIGNRGTYDVTKPNINEARGGLIHFGKGGKADVGLAIARAVEG